MTATMTGRANQTRPVWGRLAAAQVVGITYRQIDYWERSGMMTSTIPPYGSGSRARLDADCVKSLAVLAALMPHTISQPGSYPPTPTTPPWDQIVRAVTAGGRWELDPRSGRFTPAPILDCDLIIMVNVSRIAERIDAALAQLPPSGTVAPGFPQGRDPAA